MPSTDNMLHAMGKLAVRSACPNEKTRQQLDSERQLPEKQNQPSLDVLKSFFPNMGSDNTPQR